MRTLRIGLTAIIVLLSLTMYGQRKKKLQLGIKANVLSTVFLPSNLDTTDKSMYKIRPALGGGLGFVSHLDFSPNLNLAFGINAMMKSYSVRITDFKLTNIEGGVSFKPLFLSPEIPFILSYEQRMGRTDRYFAIHLGALFSYNIPIDMSVKQDGPIVSDFYSDTLVGSSFSYDEVIKSPTSLGIYAGFSLLLKNRKERYAEIGLSFQYPSMESSTYALNGNITTKKLGSVNFNNTFLPRLSYVALHYTFYPRLGIN